MGLGILEDKHLDHVPGTVLFSDDPNAAAQSVYAGIDVHQLKHGSGRNAHIILVPQPSDDPNDPLNWPQWKKHSVFFVLYVFVNIVSFAHVSNSYQGYMEVSGSI